MLSKVYWDVPSLKKLLKKKKKQSLLQVDPNPLKDRFPPVRIKSFSQNKMKQDRLSDLSLISIGGHKSVNR